MSEHMKIGLFLVGSALSVFAFGALLGLIGRLVGRRPDGPGHR